MMAFCSWAALSVWTAEIGTISCLLIFLPDRKVDGLPSLLRRRLAFHPARASAPEALRPTPVPCVPRKCRLPVNLSVSVSEREGKASSLPTLDTFGVKLGYIRDKNPLGIATQNTKVAPPKGMAVSRVPLYPPTVL